jgi:hypothetical protein
LGKTLVRDEHNGIIYRKISIDPFLHIILFFISGCKPTWHTLLILGLYLEVNMFLRLSEVFFCIISYGRGMVKSSQWTNSTKRALTSSQTELAHAIAMCEFVPGSSLKATTIVI